MQIVLLQRSIELRVYLVFLIEINQVSLLTAGSAIPRIRRMEVNLSKNSHLVDSLSSVMPILFIVAVTGLKPQPSSRLP